VESANQKSAVGRTELQFKKGSQGRIRLEGNKGTSPEQSWKSIPGRVHLSDEVSVFLHVHFKL
jgi:hypothetical protein